MSEYTGTNGLLVETEEGKRLVVVAEPGPDAFGLEELADFLEVYPDCEAVVMIKRFPDVGVVEAARSRGVLVDLFGDVAQALRSRRPLREFQSRDEKYLRSRIETHQKVSGMVRIGLGAWRVERRGLRELLIITHDRYEFPVDELLRLLSENPSLEPDAFVVTNPNTTGLSTRVKDAAAHTGIDIYLLKDFLLRLSRE